MNDQNKSLWAIIEARDISIARLQEALSKHQGECIKKEAVIQQLISVLAERDTQIGDLQQRLSDQKAECGKNDTLIQHKILETPLETPLQRSDAARETKKFLTDSGVALRKPLGKNVNLVAGQTKNSQSTAGESPVVDILPHINVQNFRFFLHRLLGAFRPRR